MTESGAHLAHGMDLMWGPLDHQSKGPHIWPPWPGSHWSHGFAPIQINCTIWCTPSRCASLLLYTPTHPNTCALPKSLSHSTTWDWSLVASMEREMPNQWLSMDRRNACWLSDYGLLDQLPDHGRRYYWSSICSNWWWCWSIWSCALHIARD